MKRICITALFLALATACSLAQEQPAAPLRGGASVEKNAKHSSGRKLLGDPKAKPSPSHPVLLRNPGAKEIQVRLRELRQDIVNLDLLNRMKVTLEQAQQIKMLIENLKLARELMKEQVLACQEGMVEVLEEARKLLAARAEKLPDEVRAKYGGLRKKIGEVTQEFFKKLEGADEELNSALTPQQCEAAQNYEGDPLSTKGEEARRKKARVTQMVKVLSRVRAASPGQLEKIREKSIQQLLGKLAQDRKIPREHVQAARQKIEQIMQEARQMDEIDYLLWQEELAQELLDATRRPRAQPRWHGKKQRGPKLSKVATVLLDERMLGALKAKIEMLKKARAAKKQKPTTREGGKQLRKERKPGKKHKP